MSLVPPLILQLTDASSAGNGKKECSKVFTFAKKLTRVNNVVSDS